VVQFAQSCGASDIQCEDIALAVSEALSNTVQHAYREDEAPGDVMVGAWLKGGLLEVVVVDAGIGMLPRAAENPGMGMGLPLIAGSTENVELESLDTIPGLRMRMTFAIGDS